MNNARSGALGRLAGCLAVAGVVFGCSASEDGGSDQGATAGLDQRATTATQPPQAVQMATQASGPIAGAAGQAGMTPTASADVGPPATEGALPANGEPAPMDAAPAQEPTQPRTMEPDVMEPDVMEPDVMEPVLDPDDPFAEYRKFCVDHINMHRATLGLSALAPANAEQNSCSDEGAKKDGDSMVGHASAGDCRSVGLPGSQNTCPGYPVGGRRAATVMDALRLCLDAMWAEGEPPGTIRECIADRSGCFLAHGHYINMIADNSVVSCGFYEMPNGSWWMNQNFGR